MDQAVKELTGEIGKLKTEMAVVKSEVHKIGKLVYGLVGMVLVAVAGAVLALVVGTGGGG